ncbi:MAG: AI-2E family transporter [Bacilli bacterium]|nr:AI-2E family transporter [Bacilli bacterium]
MSKKLNYGIINLAALMLLLYIGLSNINLWLGILGKVASVLSPFIVGFVFAYAFTPMINWMVRKGVSKNLAVTIVVLGIALIVFGMIALTLPLLYEQSKSFVKGVLEFMDNMGLKYNLNFGSFELRLTDYLNDILKEIGNIATSSTMGVINMILGFSSKFIVGFVGFIYFLADMGKIRTWSKEALLSLNKRAFSYLKCIDVEITNYLKGLLTFMIIQFFEYSFLFFIVGHPNWLILGLLACLTTVIPYFGGLITNIIAIFTATVVSVPLTIATTIICLIFPQLDGYVISPRIYGKTNNVNPLITIMAVSVGGTLLGVVGIIAALPVYLLIRTTYHFFKGDLMRGFDKVKEAI